MKILNKKILIIFFFFLFFGFFTKPCFGQVDLVDYMMSNKGGANVIQDFDASNNPLSQEFFYSYPYGINSFTGRSGFYIVKNLDGTNFEEYNYDGSYVYRLKDTSWATGPGQDVTCNDTGEEAYYAVLDGHHGPNAYLTYDPADEGGIIAPRYMSVGETFGPHPLTVVGVSEVTCIGCPTDYSGDINQYMTLEHQGPYTFSLTGWSTSDLIKLRAGGEVYFYDREYGFVGFEGAGMKAYFTGNVSSEKPSATLLCSPISIGDLELPPNRQTEWGDPIYGRNIPCRPLEVSQWLWHGFSWKDYSKPYFYYLPPLHYPEATGFPFDYSPWRPYPGDSGRLVYDHEGNPIWTGEARHLNKCYDLTTLHELNDDNRPLEDYITTYCNPAPEITDVFRWFPQDPGGETKYFEALGRFRAWWTDHPDKRISTQVPFLGNSLTSSREFTQHTQRMSLFVTDFLRGTVYWDRKDIATTDPKESRRILDESGPVRKLMPHKRTNTWDDENTPWNGLCYRNAFLGCRVFKDNSWCGFPLLHDDPVHDYVVLYTLKQNGQGRIIEEEDFENLPDRRKVKDVEINNPKKDIPMPIRLSSYFCYLEWREKPPPAQNPWYICPEGDYGDLEFMTGDVTLHGYFPLTSREDIPVFVDVAFEGLWYPKEDGNPRGMPMPEGLSFEEYIERIYRAIEEGYYGPSGYERYNGLYFIDLGDSDEYSDGQGRPYRKYEFHFVDLVFIPYVVETRELGEWAGLSLTPFSLDWEKDEETRELKFKPGKGQLCNLEEIVRGGPGDVVAGDWRHSLDLITDPYDPNQDPYHIGNEYERELWFLNMGKDTVGPNPDWGYNPLDPTRWPDRATSRLQKKGWITTYIPYLTQIGQRLVGQAGVFKTLLPHNFNQEVISLIDQATQGEIFWHELPGYGPAYYKYYNGLKNRMSKKEQWGICQMEDPENPGQMIDVPCPIGPDTEVTGWAEVNDEDARFYYPYIGTIDIFRQYFMNEMIPHGFYEIKAEEPPGETPFPPGAPGVFCTTTSGNLGIKSAIGCIPIESRELSAWLASRAIAAAGGIAFLLILFATFQIITAGGSPEKLQAGRQLLTAAIAGLLLIIFAIFLLRLIGITILGIPGL